MAKAKKHKTGMSPWQRHEKVAYRYSTTYQDWHRASKEGRTAEAARLAVHHSRLFGFGRPTPLETPISGRSDAQSRGDFYRAFDQGF